MGLKRGAGRFLSAGLTVSAASLATGTVSYADTGSITAVHAVGKSQVAATFTATWSRCTPYANGEQTCSWGLFAGELVASSPCPTDDSPQMSTAWVSNYLQGPGTITGTDSFYVIGDEPRRICLYVSQANQRHLIAETVYTPPVPNLSLRNAKTRVRQLLAEQFEGDWEYGYAQRVGGCKRRTVVRVRCDRVSWVIGDVSFRGSVTVWNARGSDGSGTEEGSFRIRRTNEYCVDRKRQRDRAYRGKPCSRVIRS